MTQLEVVPFTEDCLSLVQNFECGSAKWEIEVSDWIKGPETAEDSALSKIVAGKCEVWLYVLQNTRDVVGYGSLGQTNWRFPTPSDPRRPVKIIPFFGIQTKYFGQPPDVPSDERYASLIIRDLSFRAQKSGLNLLVLYVHRKSPRAIAFYERSGFCKLAEDPTSQDEYIKMFSVI